MIEAKLDEVFFTNLKKEELQTMFQEKLDKEDLFNYELSQKGQIRKSFKRIFIEILCLIFLGRIIIIGIILVIILLFEIGILVAKLGAKLSKNDENRHDEEKKKLNTILNYLDIIQKIINSEILFDFSGRMSFEKTKEELKVLINKFIVKNENIERKVLEEKIDNLSFLLSTKRIKYLESEENE